MPRVGGLLDPDVERILSLKPDLVIVYGTQNDLRLQLERAGISQFWSKHGGLADVTGTIRALGARLGRADAADRVATDLERRLSAIRGKVSGRARPKTLLVFDRDALTLRGIFASGGVGFIHDMLTTAGGDNVFAEVERGVRSGNGGARPAAGARGDHRNAPVGGGRRASRRAIRLVDPRLPAGRPHGTNLHLTDASLRIPGPRVAQATELMAKTLHPEAFQ